TTRQRRSIQRARAASSSAREWSDERQGQTTASAPISASRSPPRSGPQRSTRSDTALRELSSTACHRTTPTTITAAAVTSDSVRNQRRRNPVPLLYAAIAKRPRVDGFGLRNVERRLASSGRALQQHR